MDYEALAKQFGGTTQPSTSNVDYSSLAKQFGGTTQVQPEEKKKATGLQAFVQAVAEPFLKVPTTIASGVARGVAGLVGGAESAQKAQDVALEGLDYGYFGNVKPIGAGAFEKYKAGDISGGEFVTRAGLDLAGTGAEIASNFIGGTGAVGAVKTGLRGAIGQATKEFVKTGATAGGLMSFGDSLQDAESKTSDVAYDTLFGTALGAGSGLVLGPLTPLASKAVSAVKSKGISMIPTLETKLSEGYRKIFNPTAKQIKADTRFGNDSFGFLAKEMPDLPINVENGRIDASDAIEMAKMKYSAEATAYKPIIRNSGKYVDIDQVIANAKAQAKREFDGSDLKKAEQQIEEEINAYLSNNPQDINVTPNGKRFVTLARADDIKSYSWARGKGWGTPEAEVWNDTNNLIGHALKDAIEQELPNAQVKAMNKRLGQWKNAIDMLEKRNLQKTSTGGALTKNLARLGLSGIGSTLGSESGGITGGVTGGVTGFVTATALASMLANPNVRLFAVRQLLQRLQKSGRGDLIKEAEQILQEQASKYLLPAAGKSSYVETPSVISLPTSARESTLGLDVVKGAEQKTTSVNPKTGDVYVKDIKTGKTQNIPNKQGGFINPKAIVGTPKSLIEEAKKYKTAEDFVRKESFNPNSRFEYHISDNPNLTEGKLFSEQVKPKNIGERGFAGKEENIGQIFSTKNPQQWAAQLNFEGNKKPQYVYLVEVKNPAKVDIMDGLPHQSINSPADVKILKKVGGSEAIENPSIGEKVKQSQLTDIWNKANKK